MDAGFLPSRHTLHQQSPTILDGKQPAGLLLVPSFSCAPNGRRTASSLEGRASVMGRSISCARVGDLNTSRSSLVSAEDECRSFLPISCLEQTPHLHRHPVCRPGGPGGMSKPRPLAACAGRTWLLSSPAGPLCVWARTCSRQPYILPLTP
jgi:hypothetical protein